MIGSLAQLNASSQEAFFLFMPTLVALAHYPTSLSLLRTCLLYAFRLELLTLLTLHEQR